MWLKYTFLFLRWPPIFVKGYSRKYGDPTPTRLDKAPEVEGIYTIGSVENGGVLYRYVGHSKHIRTRLQQHKYQNLAIDEFVKQEFSKNNGINLRIKWKEEEDGKCLEGLYLNCMQNKLGYWPDFNKKHGNICNNC